MDRDTLQLTSSRIRTVNKILLCTIYISSKAYYIALQSPIIMSLTVRKELQRIGIENTQDTKESLHSAVEAAEETVEKVGLNASFWWRLCRR